MPIPSKFFTGVFHQGQHPYQHGVTEFLYSNTRLPGVSNVEDALNYIVGVMYPNYIGTYATPAALPGSANANDYAVVTDDGDGNSAGYIYTVIDGVSAWSKRYDVDWSADAFLQEAVNRTFPMYIARGGFDQKDASGVDIVGLYAGQTIHGGSSTNTNLTLNANSADATGYVQTDNIFRPTGDNSIDLGTATEQWQSIYAGTSVIVGTTTIAPASITDSSGSISFGNEDLVTSGTLRVDGGFKDANVSTAITLGDASNTSIATTIMDSGASLVGAINSIQTSVQRLSDTGFYSWDSGTTYYTIVGAGGSAVLRLDRGGSGYIKGKLVTWSAPQSTAAFLDNTINYVYIDSNGLIQSSTTPTGIYENNIVLFEVLDDGTNHVVVKDNHPYDFDLSASRYLHHNVGIVIRNTGAIITRVGSGTGASSTDREIKVVGEDTLDDHGVSTTIPDSAGAGVTFNWYYTSATGKWERYLQQTQAPMVWNNAGTITVLPTSGSKYSVATLYVSKDDINNTTPIYFGVIDTGSYTSVASATTAINNGTTARSTNELFGLEMAQLGYIIIENTVAGGYVNTVIVSRSTFNTRLIGSGGIGSAALVSTVTTAFDGWLSATDTTVQVALNTLDDLKFSLPVDNLLLDGNTISSTDTNGNIIINPDGAGLIELGSAIYPETTSAWDIGKSGNVWNDIWLDGSIQDGVSSFSIANLMTFSNVGSPNTGDALFWDGSKWAASNPDTEIDHSELTGLTTTDSGHTQFVMLAGRAGGQTVQGGTAASESLVLESTANASKGTIQIKDNLVPFTNASYSGGWSGTDLGSSSYYLKDLYTKGEAIGLRLQNVTTGTMPSNSAQNVGRLVWNTDDDRVYADLGTSLTAVTYKKYYTDTSWNGSDLTKDVTVSSIVDDARLAQWSFHFNADDFDRIYCSIKAISATQVRITVGTALPAGSYRLIGIE